MPLRTRFLLLLLFIFLSISAIVWFVVRPAYEEVLLNERTTIITENQRERIDRLNAQTNSWIDMMFEYEQVLVRTGSINQTELLFRGYSAIFPAFEILRLIEAETGEYIEFRSQDSYGELRFDLIIPYIEPANNSDGEPAYSVQWIADLDTIVLSRYIDLGGEIFLVTGVFNASYFQDTLFRFNLGFPAKAALWLSDGSGVGLNGIDMPAPAFSQLTLVEQQLFEKEVRIMIASPVPLFGAQHALYFAYDDLRRDVQTLFLQNLGLLMLAFFGIWIASFILFEKLTKPLRTFITDLQPFSSFDFGKPLRPIALPELREVSETMEGIRQKLQHYQEINVEKIISSQQRIMTMTEHSSDLIAFFDGSNKFVRFNAQFKQLFSELESPMPQDITSLFEMANVRVMKEGVAQQEADPPVTIQKRQLELAFTIGEEKEYYFTAQVLRLFNEKGDPLGGQFMLYDLTDERELDRKRNEMINIIVHELKNPITGIQGLITILRSEELGEDDRKEFYKIIDDSASDLFGIVQRFLQVAKLESGGIQGEAESVDMAALITRISRDLETTLRDKKIRFNQIIEEDIPPVEAVPDLMNDVIRNLLSNAVKYGPENRTIDVSAQTEITDEGTRHFVFAVTDYGFGIKEEYKDQIFKKFFRIKEYKAVQGTGLGLPYVKEIIEKHRGSITVDSNESIGSRFTVRLPYPIISKDD
ncbi:His Kinase A (phospho-acceptor) domain-containing protein [Cyclonatronum proteinivorum]|uniref:histidine kinase n=1 Tax=Cyclonatronum proteinivorum TaxID=1457365 RepID=A0A345UMS0_9BACT|nr:sensor histidine kinase [Cyclonatronum proteinivorum]AXJ01772.1 His Kinase A (phospho-acceptor) domain-containing protein [Cyclonatronum proteinivorum]